MPKVEIVIDLNKIRAYATWSFFREDWYKKEGYNCRYPQISEELKKEIKDSRKLLEQNKYNPSPEMKEVIKRETNEINLEKIKERVEVNWRPIEQKFFEMVPKIIGKQWPSEKYTCYLTPYGPGGSYFWKKHVLVIKVNEQTNERSFTIMHELIHSLIEEQIIENNIEHWVKERIVDLYLAKTPLKELWYKKPRIQKEEKKMKVDEIFEKTTNIYEIMKELMK